MLFGERILEKRKACDLSADALAKACGVSRSYITLIENCRRLPGKKIIPRIAKALEIEEQVVIEWYLEDMKEKLSKGKR